MTIDFPGMAGHCCFAGCTLVTCGSCGQQHCVRGLHFCPPKDDDEEPLPGEPS